MEYEFKYYKIFDVPRPGVPTENETTITVCCVSGVVGDVYSFDKINNFEMVIDNNLTLNEVYSVIQVECIAYVAATYPNT